MKIEIRIGDVSSNKRIKYEFEMFDDVTKEIHRMYNFLSNSKDCIIENVDMFLLYTLNNGLMAFIVKDNPNITHIDHRDEMYDLIPKLDPEIYKVFEIKEDGTEISIQEQKAPAGHITKNYFNQLMGKIMDDYYDTLNFFETDK